MPLSDEVKAERLAGFEKWLHKVASGMTGAVGHDDLVQEGRLAIWQALGKEDLDEERWPGYVALKARGRMLDVVSGRRRETGHEAPEGRTITNERGREARAKIRAYLAHHPAATGAEIARGTGLAPSTVSVQRKQLDIDAEVEEPGSLDALLDAGYDGSGYEAGLLDMIVQAYMHGEIRQALDVLTPNQRRYVHLRFWEGLTTTELTHEFGYDPQAVWRTARERLRPVLEELLAA